MKVVRRLVLVSTLVAECGCGLIGPSCLGRQRRGTVAVVSGEVGPGGISVHRVTYDIEGSQNNVDLVWPESNRVGGPRLVAYATRAACDSFGLPASANTGECRVLAATPSVNGVGVATLIVTHGRGNPEVLGMPPEFKVWVVGDDTRRVSYMLTVTWSRGPDC